MEDRLRGIFDDFENLNILIIGDVMIDSYIIGRVNRISPEAPVPIVSINKQEDRLGGAANVARNVHAMGATPILCSVIGNDQQGDQFMALLREEDIADHGIVRSNGRKTTVKQRVMSGSQQLLRIDNEDTHPVDPKDKQALIRKIEALMPQVDAIIFEDYDKGVIDEEVIGYVTQWANAHSVSVVVDPKKNNFHHYKNANLFKPNLKEIREGLNINVDGSDIAALESHIHQMMRNQSLEGVMVTLSDKGVYICYKNESHLIPAHVRNVADVSGAGDTVVTVATICMAIGLPAKTIAELSNLAGGLVCEYLGVVPINREQLLEEALKYKVI